MGGGVEPGRAGKKWRISQQVYTLAYISMMVKRGQKPGDPTCWLARNFPITVSGEREGLCCGESVRAELVEALPYAYTIGLNEGQPFDKLRANRVG